MDEIHNLKGLSYLVVKCGHSLCVVILCSEESKSNNICFVWQF